MWSLYKLVLKDVILVLFWFWPSFQIILLHFYMHEKLVFAIPSLQTINYAYFKILAFCSITCFTLWFLTCLTGDEMYFYVFCMLQKGLKIVHHADTTLSSFCSWQKNLNPQSDTHPAHHDLAVLITRQVSQKSEGFTGNSYTSNWLHL